jgi:hypothetical protein
MRLAIAFLALWMTGCVSPEQIAAQRAYEAQQQEEANRAYTAALFSQCRAIGYADGSDAQRNCVLQLHQQEQARRAALGAALLQGYMSQQPQQPYYRPQPSQTNCWQNGQYLNCTHR